LPVLSPLLLVRTPSRCPVTANPSRCFAAVIFQQSELPGFGKDSRLGPLLEMLMGRGTGTVLAWKHFPRASGPQDIQDAVEVRPMGSRWITSLERTYIVRQERLDLGPKLIGGIASARFPWQWLSRLGLACRGCTLQKAKIVQLPYEQSRSPRF
jgi:hypothetical protein